MNKKVFRFILHLVNDSYHHWNVVLSKKPDGCRKLTASEFMKNEFCPPPQGAPNTRAASPPRLPSLSQGLMFFFVFFLNTHNRRQNNENL